MILEFNESMKIRKMSNIINHLIEVSFSLIIE